MKKITTLFKKDALNLGRVINEINPGNEWALTADSIATRKFDGSAAAIIDGELYKRYDAKKGKLVPDGAIPCQEADITSGHHPHWLKCDRSKSDDRYFFEAFDALTHKEDGTYELCGEKVNSNREKLEGHHLIRHGKHQLTIKSLDFEYLKEYLSDEENDIEGIVFYNIVDGSMCKLRKSDFGIKRL